MIILPILSVAAVLLMYLKLRREKALFRKERAWLRSILDAIKAPISVTNKDMEWTLVNKALEQFLDLKREDIIGKKCSQWGADICNTENCGIARIKNGFSGTYFEQFGGAYNVLVSNIFNEKGEPDGYVEVVEDITELKEVTERQAEIEAASKSKSNFLTTVSHEIRTPMNAIMGIAEIQLQNTAHSREIQEALSEIYNSGYLLLSIINDILDLSKIEAGKMELVPVKYDVPSLIHDTVQLNIMRFDNKPIEFVIQVDENIPSFMFGDELRIKQILNNLLSNAFKYTDKGQVSLTVEAEFAGQKETDLLTLIFRVSDTGQGMSKEQVDKLFNEYTRYNLEANRKTQGTGLGMNITKYLVEMMDGEIAVESEQGKGTTFTVRVSQEKVGSDVLGKELTENLKHFRLSGAGPIKRAPQITHEYMPYGRILIVDDVETNLYVARGLMAPYGLSIETAESGIEAIDKIKNGSIFDIIFMDHFMPEMDGIEATKIIRDNGYTRPIVALTANALTGQMEVFLANGFDAFISKPIDMRQLNSTLNKLVRDKHPQEEVEAARRLKDTLKNRSGGTAPEPPAGSQLAEFFMRDAKKAISILEAIHVNNYRRNNDMQMYIITVHAMKSALANIGEKELSDAAYRLEQAGRDGDTAVIMDEIPGFLKNLYAVIKKISSKDDKREKAKITGDDQAYLRKKLTVIQEACAVYDNKAAKETLAELKEKSWSPQINELLDIIAGHLLHSDFEEAANAAGDFDTDLTE
ncbi:MAG: response regulator [Treponema sp.]|nr:response regulator [Treponema sp.]